MNALERGLEKLGGETQNFVDMVAVRRKTPLRMPRDRICARWALSYEQLHALEDHFAMQIGAAAAPPTVSGVERSLPPGDR